MYRYNEKLIKGADCKAIAYKRELDRCFNVKTSVVYATDNELYKLMDEKEIYVILPENEVFSFTEELTNNKVIKRVLKCK